MNVNHQDTVQRVYNEQAPEHTAESVLAFTVRVIAALPRDERAGLLRKDAGDNIVNFHGVMVSAGRICYPDGQLCKIATDIPATDAPVWNDDGTVDPARYFDVTPFIDPAPVPAPIPFPRPAPPPPAPDPDQAVFDKADEIIWAIERMIVGLEAVRAAIDGLDKTEAALAVKGIAAHLRF